MPAQFINVPSSVTVSLPRDMRRTNVIVLKDILEMSVNTDHTATRITESTCVKMEANAG